jgi:hypothetical protein
VRGTVRLAVSQSRLRALLYDRATVVSERELPDGGWEIDLELDKRGYLSLQRTENLLFDTPSRVPATALQ